MVSSVSLSKFFKAFKCLSQELILRNLIEENHVRNSLVVWATQLIEDILKMLKYFEITLRHQSAQ